MIKTKKIKVKSIENEKTIITRIIRIITIGMRIKIGNRIKTLKH